MNADSTLVNFKPVSGKTTDYGTVKEVVLIFKDTKSSEQVETVVIYDKKTNKGEVISVKPVTSPAGESGVAPTGEEGFVPSGEEGFVPAGETGQEPKPKIAICVRPTTSVPQVLIPEVIKTDKDLGKVVKNIQQIDPTYQNVIPISVEV